MTTARLICEKYLPPHVLNTLINKLSTGRYHTHVGGNLLRVDLFDIKAQYDRISWVFPGPVLSVESGGRTYIVHCREKLNDHKGFIEFALALMLSHKDIFPDHGCLNLSKEDFPELH